MRGSALLRRNLAQRRGVIPEPDGDGRVYNSASGQLIGRNSFRASDELKRSLNLYSFYDTNQWRAWTSTMDFSFGRRFHGSVIALQAGVPSLMVTVDDRMREMLDFSGLRAARVARLRIVGIEVREVTIGGGFIRRER